MAEERRKEPEWWFKRQGASFRQKARDESEASATRRRVTQRLILRQNDRDEEENDFREDGERPKLSD